MSYWTTCLLLAALVGISAVCAQSGSGNDTDSGSGSGSGSGDISCYNLQCSHGCNETSMGPMCYCPIGYELGMDGMTCQICRGGYWGVDCSMVCDCSAGGAGNPCNNVDGTCICNSCWMGTRCETSLGSNCFLEFLQIENKDVSILQQRYGGAAFPVPPSDSLSSLIIDDLLAITSTDASDLAIVADPELTTVPRGDVGQGDLAQLTFTVDYTVNRPLAEQGLASLEEKVNLGSLRVTLIQQIFTNTAQVTINAGTQQN